YPQEDYWRPIGARWEQFLRQLAASGHRPQHCWIVPVHSVSDHFTREMKKGSGTVSAAKRCLTLWEFGPYTRVAAVMLPAVRSCRFGLIFRRPMLPPRRAGPLGVLRPSAAPLERRNQ